MDAWVELVVEAQRGNAEAFRSLVDRFQCMACAYAYSVVGNLQLAEDVTQEALIDAYQHLLDLRAPEAFPVWLKRIVYKYCDRLIRRRQPVTEPLEVLERLMSPAPEPQHLAERRDQQAQVWEALLSLSEEQRVVTVLSYMGGYSQKEISDFLELPPSTVKSRLYDARRHLERYFMHNLRAALRSNALPESFSEETVRRAIAAAQQLAQQRQYPEAESLIEDVLHKFPAHPEALGVLRHTALWGQVYTRSRWDLLPEIVRNGRALLKAAYNEPAARDTACALLAIPAMGEAVAFIESWIAGRGASRERLGMLAWAKGCCGDYEAAEQVWDRQRALAMTASPDDVLGCVPFTATTLVDCLMAAGQVSRAQRIARHAWDQCGALGAIPLVPYRGDYDWVRMFVQADLPVDAVVPPLLTRHQASGRPADHGVALAIEAWTAPAAALIPVYVAWVRAYGAAGEWPLVRHIHFALSAALHYTGQPEALIALAEQLAGVLPEGRHYDLQQLRHVLPVARYPWRTYLRQDNLEAAEIVAREALAAGYGPIGHPALLDIAVRRGKATPLETVALVETDGVEGFGDAARGWYVRAREAAAQGQAQVALDALEQALGYWTHPPLAHVQAWYGDGYWGGLREHPRYEHAFVTARERIGPVYGDLQYFPMGEGWVR